jgi:hypothetical protein
MQLPNLQFIRSIPVWGPRIYEAFNAVQQQTTRIEKQGNLNATGDPPVPPPPDALNVTNGPSGEYQIAITHNGEFNRGTSFHVQWDTSPHFTNPHNIDLGASRNDSRLYLPGQTAYFRASAASPSGANSAWTYHGSQNNPAPVIGGVRGVRAPGMGSGTGAPGDQSGGPGPIQERNSASGYDWKAQQRSTGSGSGASTQGAIAGGGASGGAGGGGGGLTLTEAQIAAAETLTVAGTGNAVTGTTSPTYSSRVVGQVIRYIPAHANTSTVTINENGIGAVAITKNGTTALAGGEFVVGKASFLMWDGTEYQIVEVLAPISATVLGSDAHGVPTAAPLADTKIWIGQGTGLPAAETVSGDATLADTGVLTLKTVNVSPGTYTNATVTVDAQGRATVVVAGTGGAAAGSPTDIQFNTAGALDASGDLTWSGSVMFVNGGVSATSVEGSATVAVGVGGSFAAGASTGFTGTLAAAIAAGKSVVGGIIVN